MSYVFPQQAFGARRKSDFQEAKLTISDLMSRMALNIPHYQRDYRWTAEHIMKLMNDIFQLAEFDMQGGEKANGTHMLTTIVLHEEEKEGARIHNLVDGQQRVTTLYLLLATLLREVEQHKTKGNADAATVAYAIGQLLFSHGWNNNTKPTPKMSHSLAEESATFAQILDHKIPAYKLTGNKHMINAIKTMRDAMRDHAETVVGEKLGMREPLPLNYIQFIYTIATEGLEVSSLTTRCPNEARKAYHNINATGASLTNMELVRLEFAAQTPGNDFATIWSKMSNALGKENADTFLQSWLLARYDRTSVKTGLYSTFLQLIKLGELTPDTETLTLLMEDAVLYGEHISGSSKGQSISGLFWTENLGYRQHRPLLIAAGHLADDFDMMSLLAYEISKTAMCATINKVPASKMTRFWAKCAKEIKTVYTMEDLQTFLDERMRGLREMMGKTLATNILALSDKTTWSKDRPGKNRTQYTVLAYYAYTLEEAIGNARGGPKGFMETASLEHIIPVNDGFKNDAPMSVDEFRKHVTHLGNLTFLTKKENSNVGTKSLADKIKAYADSSMALSRASVKDLALQKSRSKSAKILKIIPRITETFRLKDVEDRGKNLADIIAETLVA